MFGNVKSLAYYDSNKDDPYITLQEVRSKSFQLLRIVEVTLPRTITMGMRIEKSYKFSQPIIFFWRQRLRTRWLIWKSMYMRTKPIISMCTMISCYQPYHSAWNGLMYQLRRSRLTRAPKEISLPLARSTPTSRFGIWIRSIVCTPMPFLAKEVTMMKWVDPSPPRRKRRSGRNPKRPMSITMWMRFFPSRPTGSIATCWRRRPRITPSNCGTSTRRHAPSRTLTTRIKYVRSPGIQRRPLCS